MERNNSPEMDRGIALFNRGEYFEAHEAWEKLWLSLNESPEKAFIKGLIKIAAALHHYLRKELSGSTRLFESGSVLVRQLGGNNPWLIDATDLLAQTELFSAKMARSSEPFENILPVIRKHKG